MGRRLRFDLFDSVADYVENAFREAKRCLFSLVNVLKEVEAEDQDLGLCTAPLPCPSHHESEHLRDVVQGPLISHEVDSFCTVAFSRET